MKITIFLASFALIIAQGLAEKEYVIDLDVAPEKRYDELANDNKELIIKAYEAIKRNVTRNLWEIVADAYDGVAVKKYKEYAQEMYGISKILNISAKNFYVLNCFYEIDAMCTSIVARDKNNKLFLARNFDFGFTDILRQIHVNIVYKRGNKEIARCGNIAGFIGAFTCMRLNSFAIALNERDLDNLQEFLKRLIGGRILSTWLLREAILNTDNYEDAVSLLKNTPTVSGAYFAVAGVKENEGTVITRDRDFVFSFTKLSKNVWYLAKCNSDDGDMSDKRTRWVNEAMTKLGQKNTDLDIVLNDILLKDPLLVPTTVATLLMSPVDNYYKSIIPRNNSKSEFTLS